MEFISYLVLWAFNSISLSLSFGPRISIWTIIQEVFLSSLVNNKFKVRAHDWFLNGSNRVEVIYSTKNTLGNNRFRNKYFSFFILKAKIVRVKITTQFLKYWMLISILHYILNIIWYWVSFKFIQYSMTDDIRTIHQNK